MRLAHLVAAGLAALGLCSLVVPASAAGRTQILECNDHGPFANTTLLIVTTVKPAGGQTWTFADAPSVVAQRVLADLNGNTGGLIFKEANGVIPNLYINITLSETNSGTQQDSAYANVVAFESWFNESSGQAPYIGWRDAIDHLSTGMLTWLQGGWHANHPCRTRTGTIRQTWP